MRRRERGEREGGREEGEKGEREGEKEEREEGERGREEGKGREEEGVSYANSLWITELMKRIEVIRRRRQRGGRRSRG